MKKFIIILLIVATYSCKAQSIIKPMGTSEFCGNNPDCYEKDVNNEFGKFEGTWKYQNDTDEITFKLKKEEHYRISNDTNYEDLLVGEYQFKENGTEKVNTLSDFDNTAISGYDHKISGGVFVHRIPSNCIGNVNSNETMIELFIEDPNNHLIEGRLTLRYINDNGTEKLEICILDYTTLADDVDARIDIPDGYYEFTKIE